MTAEHEILAKRTEVSDASALATAGATAGATGSDLDSRSAIHDLVVEFYREIVFDEVLDPMFSEVAEVDWTEHIPKLVDYWCRILLRTEDYSGPIMAAHRDLHDMEPVTLEHCDRWYDLWVRSVDSSWEGPVAEHAKSHAASVMAGMARHVFGVAWTPSAQRA